MVDRSVARGQDELRCWMSDSGTSNDRAGSRTALEAGVKRDDVVEAAVKLRLVGYFNDQDERISPVKPQTCT